MGFSKIFLEYKEGKQEREEGRKRERSMYRKSLVSLTGEDDGMMMMKMMMKVMIKIMVTVAANSDD